MRGVRVSSRFSEYRRFCPRTGDFPLTGRHGTEKARRVERHGVWNF